ncbi:MAG: GNAT family N-acetyltransferase [Candidatus Oleimicrobiaceae bacterium]
MWALRLNRMVHELKTGGIPALVHYIGQRLVRRNTFLVFAVDLRLPQVSYPCPEGFVLRLVQETEDEIERLVSFWLASYADNYPLFYNQELVRRLISERLAAGELCFVAEHQGAIAHFHWISRYGRCALNREEPLKFLPFRPGRDAYSYNIFTHPDYRGKGLVLAVHSFLCDWLRQHGCERLLSCVGSGNTASIKVHQKVATQVSTLHVTRYLVCDRARIVAAPRR